MDSIVCATHRWRHTGSHSCFVQIVVVDNQTSTLSYLDKFVVPYLEQQIPNKSNHPTPWDSDVALGVDFPPFGDNNRMHLGNSPEKCPV